MRERARERDGGRGLEGAARAGGAPQGVGGRDGAVAERGEGERGGRLGRAGWRPARIRVGRVPQRERERVGRELVVDVCLLLARVARVGGGGGGARAANGGQAAVYTGEVAEAPGSPC